MRHHREWMQKARSQVDQWLGKGRLLGIRDDGETTAEAEPEVWRHANEEPLEVADADGPGLATYGPEDGTVRAAADEPTRQRSKAARDDQGLHDAQGRHEAEGSSRDA